MLISKTYLSQYSKIINVISYRVNTYLVNNEIIQDELKITTSFFLRFLANKNPFYNEIVIYQKNKKRILFEPIIQLKYIQKFILNTILYKFNYKYNFLPCVKGFLPKEDIVKNATPHLNKVAIIKMDIKDFFPSITRKMVYNVFRKYNKFSYEYAYILSHLVTYKNSLPQGAPTSPFLANICAKGIDYKIYKLIDVINKREDMNIAYTRYADDITISFDKKFNYDYVVNVVTKIIFDEGFYPNFKKTKIIKNNHCQKVTGIVVNNVVPGIESKERKKIKFILSIWKKYGIYDAIVLWNKHKFGRIINVTTEDRGVGKFVEVIEGKITYFQMVNIDQNRKLFKMYEELHDEL